MKDNGQFKKGDEPWNKNMKGIHLSPHSEFKSGEQHTGKNHPSWKGGVQTFANDCKYIWTGTNERKRRPRSVYEENFGPIPKGYVIRHIDGDKNNDHPSNLQAISRAENMKLNSNKNGK